jgi:hypothetical protein
LEAEFIGWLDFIVLRPGALAVWVKRKKYKVPKQRDDKEEPKARHLTGKHHGTPKPLGDVYFVGKNTVTLPADYGLLPQDFEIYDLLDLGLTQYLELEELALLNA